MNLHQEVGRYVSLGHIIETTKEIYYPVTGYHPPIQCGIRTFPLHNISAPGVILAINKAKPHPTMPSRGRTVLDGVLVRLGFREWRRGP